MEKIALVTINYNGKKDTLEFLRSLKKLRTMNYELRTIVVDNGSDDGSVTAIHQQFPEVDILQAGGNLGFSGGFNKGLEYAKIWGADYFLLINNDCLIKDPDLVTELIKTAESSLRIGLVSPKIYFAPGFEFHKDKYKKEDLGKVIWFAGGRFDWDNIGNIHRGIDEVDKGQYDGIEHAQIFSGACVLVKKEVLSSFAKASASADSKSATSDWRSEDKGGFDEKYFLYFEDSDLAKRAIDAGYKIYYNGKVALYHKVSQSTGIGSKITDYYHTRNRLIFGMQFGKNRTKFALLREAVKLLVFGRPAQRRGVLDFCLGITGGQHLGGVNQTFGAHLRGECNGEYPLKLSIGIVNYNTADLTKKLLASIFKAGSGFNSENMEAIVLDNGKIDPCKDKIKEFLPRIKYLENAENEGFSRGYNKTIKYSLGQYYLMLNSDIEVLKDGISRLVEVEEGLAEKGVLGGKLVFPDGSDQDSAFYLPTLTGAFKEYFLAKKGAYFMYEPPLHLTRALVEQRGECKESASSHLGGVIRVDGLVMACLLIPKKVLNRVGLLDEGSFIFFEDIEYARRLKQFNVPLYFVPQAKFIHHHGASTKRIGQEKANEHLIKASKYYHGKVYYLLLTLVLRLGQKFGRVQTPVSKWTKET